MLHLLPWLPLPAFEYCHPCFKCRLSPGRELSNDTTEKTRAFGVLAFLAQSAEKPAANEAEPGFVSNALGSLDHCSASRPRPVPSRQEPVELSLDRGDLPVQASLRRVPAIIVL